MKNFTISIVFIIYLSMLFGCTLAEVKVDVVSERTALENQILGSYNSLDREMLLAASVRGVDSEGNIQAPPPHSREHMDAVTAMQIQAFHVDDLQRFKQLGWVGENREGLLTAFDMNRENVPQYLKTFADNYKPEEFKSVVEQINQSREVIMRRVLDMNENLSDSDFPKVQKIFGKFNTENAVKGEKIQAENGEWTVK